MVPNGQSDHVVGKIQDKRSSSFNKHLGSLNSQRRRGKMQNHKSSPPLTVDIAQKKLAETVFAHTKDKKKAAGRALGTLVEVVTYYLVHAWGMRNNILIERPIPEYGNPKIKHNVEFTLHGINNEIPLNSEEEVSLPLSIAKLNKIFDLGSPNKKHQLLETAGIIRNSCVIKDDTSGRVSALHLENHSTQSTRVSLIEVFEKPFALFECKRVGVEDGMRKGPQTIEKAKQGAYVAKTVSSIQKVWLPSGEQGGLLFDDKGQPIAFPYREIVKRIIETLEPQITIKDMVLTVGIVSNHGNWFTNDDPNKEMRVLTAAYDWLLFLTDVGLLQFIERLLGDQPGLPKASRAFLTSYGPGRNKNRFTKTRMDKEAHQELIDYFESNLEKVEGWFNVIGPSKGTVAELRDILQTLAEVKWNDIHKERGDE